MLQNHQERGTKKDFGRFCYTEPMHIPDGYLSPGTAGVFYGAMLPVWYGAARRVRSALSARLLPVMALMSAFCFVIQMLNVPLPGGTTGHAVGAGLAAIVLGPWPAVIAVSATLVVQALLFGDGGITAIGANCFNMAFVQVLVSYYLYRITSVKASTPAGHGAAAAVSCYIGMNVSALVAGVQLGLQPLLAHSPDGTPLYAPYPLSVAVPAMVLGHLVAGLAEAVVAAAGVSYMQRSAPELFVPAAAPAAELPLFWRRLRTWWIVIGALVILTPLGLLAPGTAWGEWGSDQLSELGLRFVPEGLARLEGFWKAIFAGYSVPGIGEKAGYVMSAGLGVAFIALVFWGLTLAGRRSAAHDGH